MGAIRRLTALLGLPLLVAGGLTSATLLTSAPASAAPVTCTTTITGTHPTQLTVTSGVTCLVNATQNGQVTVDAGAGLSVTSSTVNGTVTATDPTSVTYCASTENGTLKVTGATGAVTLGDGGSCAADTIPSLITVTGAAGPVDVSGLRENGTLTLSGNTGGVTLNGINLSGLAYVQDNTGTGAVTVSGNHIAGSLYCTGNAPAPVDNGAVNIVSGTATGQCAALSSRTPVTHSAPVLAGIEASALAYTAGAPAVPVTASLTVSSSDATTLAGATVTISSGFLPGEDSLGFTAQNGITGSYDAATGVLTLTGTSSLANYQLALRSVTYRDSNAQAATSTRTIGFQVNDGSPADNLSNSVSRAVDVTAPAKVSPVLANVETSALSYQAKGPAVAVTSTLTISDGGTATLSGATVSITAGFASGSDTLGFTAQNGITGTYDATTGVLTLSGSAPLASYQAALRSVTFTSADSSASPAARTVSFAVTDSNSQASNTVSRTVNVTTAAVPQPTAVGHTYAAVGNTPLGVGTAPTGPAATASGGLLSGDSGSGTLTVTAHTTPAHGTVTVNDATGAFTYLPDAGYTGADSFQYTIAGSDAPAETSTATVTVNVGTVVWYVDSAASAAGNGEAGTPFSTLAAANAALGSGSIVFLYQGSGSYAGGLTLKPGDSLFGQPHGLTVAGYNLVAAGGSNPTITNSAGNGIDLASDVDIEDVNVSGASGNGINGSAVTGSVTIKGSTVTGSSVNNAVITDTSGSLSLTVTGSTFSNDTATGNNDDGLAVNANGSTSATVSVTGSTFTNNAGNAFQFETDSGSSGGSNTVTFSGNTVSSTSNTPGGAIRAGNVLIDPYGSSDTAITIDGNTITNAVSDGIGIDKDGSGGTLSGTVNGNTIGSAAAVSSGSSEENDIGVYAEGSPTETLAITNNNLYQYANTSGIYAISRQGSPAMNLTITGNTIADPVSTALWGLEVEAGAQTGDAGLLCANISGNSMAGSAPSAASGGISDFELDQEFGTTIELPGYAGANNNDSAVVSFVQGKNNSGAAPTGTATDNVAGGGGGFKGGSGCATP